MTEKKPTLTERVAALEDELTELVDEFNPHRRRLEEDVLKANQRSKQTSDQVNKVEKSVASLQDEVKDCHASALKQIEVLEQSFEKAEVDVKQRVLDLEESLGQFNFRFTHVTASVNEKRGEIKALQGYLKRTTQELHDCMSVLPKRYRRKMAKKLSKCEPAPDWLGSDLEGW